MLKVLVRNWDRGLTRWIRTLARVNRYCQPPGEHFCQFSLLHRLGNEIAHPGLNTFISVTPHGRGGHSDYGNARVGSASDIIPAICLAASVSIHPYVSQRA